MLSKVALILLPIAAFVQAKDFDPSCNATDQSAGKATVALSKESVLMQMEIQPQLLQKRAGNQQYALVVLNQKDRNVANHIRTFNQDPTNVAAVIQSGLQAILQATGHFMAQPPRVADGITSLGENLFECVEKLLSDDHKQAEEFLSFKEAWTAGFEAIPSMADSIENDINRYVRDGDTPPLIRAIGSIINEAGMIVSNFLLPETGTEIVKYLNAINQAFQTMGESWDAFEQGKTVDGIEAIYWGLRSMTDGLLPDRFKDDPLYNTIIGTLDFVLGNLSTHILEYERLIMESNVCWRTEKNRDSQRPMYCPEKYAWDGVGYCYPMLALASTKSTVSTKSTALVTTKSNQLDKALAKKGGDNGGGDNHYNPSHNAIPARCDVDGYYSEKHGMYCYTPCGAGWQQKDGATKCISACEGNFSAETPLMCGRDSGIITKTIMDMVTTVLNTAFTLADNIMTMQEHGVNAETLTSTIQVFINLGKPFANPTCPSPAPTPFPMGIEDDDSGSSATSRRRSIKKDKVECSFGAAMYLTSHRGKHLKDEGGYVSVRSAPTPWTFSDAGNGKVYISSGRGGHLSDQNGDVGVASSTQAWEKWALFDAGDGKVFVRSHRYQTLADNNGQVSMSWSHLDWEMWSIEGADGNSVCQVVSSPEPSAEQLMQRRARVGAARITNGY